LGGVVEAERRDETRAIDLRQLRDAQAPDFKGNKIPAGATDGSVAWIRLDSVAVEGRLMVIQQQQGMASSYDCTICSCPAGFTGLTVAPVTFGILPLAYEDMGSTGRYQSCNGSSTYYYDLTSFSDWTSNNTPVIAMDGSIHYRADGIAGGTANVTGSFTDCSMYDTNPDFSCPCISAPTYSGGSAGDVVWVTLSLKTSGTLASDDFAASTMTNLLGTNNLHTLMDTNGYWVTPVEVVGHVAPSTYTGNIIIRRQLLGVYVYDNCTLVQSQGPGDDTSQYPLYDWDPQSGGSAGKVYDTDEPGILPQSSNTVNHVYHFRANFYEYAQTTINGVVKTVSSNLNWFARVSYLKTSSGSQLSTTISGDNIAGTGTTKTSCNLQ
jgi:hypothetical protein